jgi:carotenoid epsilon hydroxylase
VGDQFALMEAVVSLAVLVKRFDVEMVPNQDPGMTTGATIHTINGLYVTVKDRAAISASAVAASAAV